MTKKMVNKEQQTCSSSICLKNHFSKSTIPPKCQKRNHNLITNNWVSILFSIPTLICRASLSHQHSLRIFCVRCLVLCHHTLIMRVISWSFWGKLMIIMVHLNKKVKLFWLEKKQGIPWGEVTWNVFQKNIIFRQIEEVDIS